MLLVETSHTPIGCCQEKYFYFVFVNLLKCILLCLSFLSTLAIASDLVREGFRLESSKTFVNEGTKNFQLKPKKVKLEDRTRLSYRIMIRKALFCRHKNFRRPAEIIFHHCHMNLQEISTKEICF